jgi:Mrp family chromosome partitioning ATPase
MIRQLAASFSEEFYTLHRTLFGPRGQTDTTAIQFCASHLSEGVTSTTLAFALSIANTYGPHSVIAVEANLRKPSFNQMLGINPRETLADVLRGQIPLRDAIQNPGELGISVITAGNESTEAERLPVDPLLNKLGVALAELKQTYPLVLVDSPPVIPFVDASVIAGEVDKVVLVVEARVTRSEVVNRSIDKLKTSGRDISGIILTKRQFSIPKLLYRFL